VVQESKQRAGGVTQVVERLLSKHEVQSSKNPVLQKKKKQPQTKKPVIKTTW
jgi:hypothetical protein